MEFGLEMYFVLMIKSRKRKTQTGIDLKIRKVSARLKKRKITSNLECWKMSLSNKQR